MLERKERDRRILAGFQIPGHRRRRCTGCGHQANQHRSYGCVAVGCPCTKMREKR